MIKSHHIEICVETLASAVNAEKGGATRVEVCQALSVGGLSATSGLLCAVKRAIEIPAVYLVRPRPGGFVYNSDEVSIMLEDIQNAIRNGADGIAIGALTPEKTIDKKVCKILMEPALKNQIPVTFHRAFDYARCPSSALQDIIELGFSRVLTSGCAKDALTGAPVIRDLVQQGGTAISVIPAGGITPLNVQEIIRITGASEIHGSASSKRQDLLDSDGNLTNDNVRLGDSNEFVVKMCTIESVQHLKNQAECAWGTKIEP